MDDERLKLDRWDTLNSGERLAVARAVAARLPAPWRLLGLETHALGDQRHEIAFFDWNGAKFSLIPGGTVTLGYDQEHPFVPNAEQQASWYGDEPEAGTTAWTTLPDGEVLVAYSGKATRDWEIPPLEEHLDYCMTPLRLVSLDPFLLEVCARELGITPVAADKAAQLQSELGFLADENGNPRQWYQAQSVTHEAACTEAAKDGFRIPTWDEWEHACAAGSRTLWRWGNDCPTTHYPIDDEATDESAWDFHRRPNAFGLSIASDPYDWEFCAEPGIMRGGDGGSEICGGAGFLAGWLTLASAFYCRHFSVDGTFGTHLRRAYTLP